jgi:hypothetical protein
MTVIEEFSEDTPYPFSFCAATENVYPLPDVSHGISIGEPVPVYSILPGETVTLYPVIGDPPSFCGGRKLILAHPARARANIFFGASGRVPAATTIFTHPKLFRKGSTGVIHENIKIRSQKLTIFLRDIDGSVMEIKRFTILCSHKKEK